ncbi:isochorismatase family cysteine hydrolase [Ochrobactrum vermis]|uniref:Isochorismatase family cysteine hydrolase n=1 Tax=Ochrobactrum vermis TaxID=1827297 RepID=A0ABU8PL90_9HYPH|nr:isochorismatase family cysteine hydrolase [Ochrobactrum vermis]PQZ24405.1 cysteine hydrolase [Ochrobactrum vermis]
MPFKTGLTRGDLGDCCIHLCIDTQNLFGPSSPWHVPWTETILPNIVEICSRQPARTVFTRFIPPKTPEATFGMWKRYYRKWEMLTLDRIDPVLIRVIEPLQQFSPPAVVLDKRVYSPWTEGLLQRHLNTRNIHTVIISGAETDLCVLAALLGAVDLGYRTILVSDAVCSVSDQAHDAVIALCHERFSEQRELVRTDELIGSWR